MALDQTMTDGGAAKPRLITPVFLLITASTFAYFVAVGVLIPALPRFVEGQLGGRGDAVGLAVGAFSLTAVIIRPLTGRLGDAHGRRLLTLGGAGLVGLSIAAYALADSLVPLIALRLVSGVGEAAFYVGVASAINDLAPDERRGEALSFFSLALYAGLAIGPLIGELVIDSMSFTAAWLVAAGACGIAFALGLGIPDTRPEVEVDHASHLVHRAALLPGAVLAAGIWGLAGFSSFVPLYALELGMSAAWPAFATYSIIVLSIRSFGATIPDRLGPGRTARFSLVLTAVGLGVIAGWRQPAGLIAGAAVFAVGQATAFPALMTIAIRSAPPSQRGAAVGTFTAFFDLAFGLGSVSLGYVVRLAGYNASFFAAALIAGAGATLMWARKAGVVTIGGPSPPRVEEACEPR